MSDQYIVNGKTYNSMDEMPPDVRARYDMLNNLLADKNQDGTPDIMADAMNAGTTVIQSSTIIYQGKTYNSVDELPPDARAKYEQAMAQLADQNQNGTPDVLESAAQSSVIVSTSLNPAPNVSAAPNSSEQNIGPIIVLGIMAIGLAIIIAILLFLLLRRGG